MSHIYRLFPTLALVFAIALPSAAEVYKTVDDKGNVSYTDNPPADKAGEPVKLPAINTQPALQLKPKASQKDPTDSGYEEISILSPAQDATIPPGQLNVVVQVFLQPALKPGHRVQLLHNGQPQGDPAYATSFAIDQLSRGEHSLQAQVVDEKGDIIASSSTVTIHVKRTSILNKPAAKNKNTSSN